MDDCGNTDSSVAVGVGDQLYDGRVHSHRAGDCHYRCGSRLHSGATRVVNQVPLFHESLRKKEVL
jgi:hypothetical protein